jgi:hypothetical protein
LKPSRGGRRSGRASRFPSGKVIPATAGFTTTNFKIPINRYIVNRLTRLDATD